MKQIAGFKRFTCNLELFLDIYGYFGYYDLVIKDTSILGFGTYFYGDKDEGT